MTIDKRPEHATFPTPTQTSSTKTTGNNTWIMDESARNKLLKRYKTQVASGTSTICATLTVVGEARQGNPVGVKMNN